MAHGGDGLGGDRGLQQTKGERSGRKPQGHQRDFRAEIRGQSRRQGVGCLWGRGCLEEGSRSQ